MKINRWQKILLLILSVELAILAGILLNQPSREDFTGDRFTKGFQPTGSYLFSPTPNPPQFSIIAGGTVVLSRGVAERINKYQDATYPWQKIADEFRKASLAIVNFKGPLVKDCIYDPETLVFCGQPDYVQGLSFAGIDLVSLAGNHIGDYGTEGILQTIDILDEHQILHAGAGKDINEAHQPAIYEIPSFPTSNLPGLAEALPRAGQSPRPRRGSAEGGPTSKIKIGFLAYNSVPTKTPIATNLSPGIAWLTPENLERDIKALRPQVDILIIMPNWGEEYTREPSEFQVEMGHKMIDLGADLVLGDQAHWVQKIEEYKGKYIFYGLGNLVFDQMWSQETREGLVVKFNFEGADLKSLDLMPVIIQDYAQPRWADEGVKKKILDGSEYGI